MIVFTTMNRNRVAINPKEIAAITAVPADGRGSCTLIYLRSWGAENTISVNSSFDDVLKAIKDAL